MFARVGDIFFWTASGGAALLTVLAAVALIFNQGPQRFYASVPVLAIASICWAFGFALRHVFAEPPRGESP